MTQKQTKNGFSVIEVLTVIVVIVILAGAGFFVWNKTKKHDATNHSAKGSQPDKQASGKSGTDTADPYEGWATYNNSTYGISFRYPTDWKTDEAEGTTDLATASTPITTRFAANLKRDEEVKYNNTASVEVLNQDIATAIAWYDGYFSGSQFNKVAKTSDDLKGKQSAQYVVANNDSTEKVYLFSVDSKTYVFSSKNEWLNTQSDAEYWTKFDKVLDSLKIN